MSAVEQKTADPELSQFEELRSRANLLNNNKEEHEKFKVMLEKKLERAINISNFMKTLESKIKTKSGAHKKEFLIFKEAVETAEVADIILATENAFAATLANAIKEKKLDVIALRFDGKKKPPLAKLKNLISFSPGKGVDENKFWKEIQTEWPEIRNLTLTIYKNIVEFEEAPADKKAETPIGKFIKKYPKASVAIGIVTAIAGAVVAYKVAKGIFGMIFGEEKSLKERAGGLALGVASVAGLAMGVNSEAFRDLVKGLTGFDIPEKWLPESWRDFLKKHNPINLGEKPTETHKTIIENYLSFFEEEEIAYLGKFKYADIMDGSWRGTFAGIATQMFPSLSEITNLPAEAYKKTERLRIFFAKNETRIKKYIETGPNTTVNQIFGVINNNPEEAWEKLTPEEMLSNEKKEELNTEEKKALIKKVSELIPDIAALIEHPNYELLEKVRSKGGEVVIDGVKNLGIIFMPGYGAIEFVWPNALGAISLIQEKMRDNAAMFAWANGNDWKLAMTFVAKKYSNIYLDGGGKYLIAAGATGGALLGSLKGVVQMGSDLKNGRLIRMVFRIPAETIRGAIKGTLRTALLPAEVLVKIPGATARYNTLRQSLGDKVRFVKSSGWIKGFEYTLRKRQSPIFRKLLDGKTSPAKATNVLNDYLRATIKKKSNARTDYGKNRFREVKNRIESELNAIENKNWLKTAKPKAVYRYALDQKTNTEKSKFIKEAIEKKKIEIEKVSNNKISGKAAATQAKKELKAAYEKDFSQSKKQSVARPVAEAKQAPATKPPGPGETYRTKSGVGVTKTGNVFRPNFTQKPTPPPPILATDGNLALKPNPRTLLKTQKIPELIRSAPPANDYQVYKKWAVSQGEEPIPRPELRKKVGKFSGSGTLLRGVGLYIAIHRVASAPDKREAIVTIGAEMAIFYGVYRLTGSHPLWSTLAGLFTVFAVSFIPAEYTRAIKKRVAELLPKGLNDKRYESFWMAGSVFTNTYATDHIYNYFSTGTNARAFLERKTVGLNVFKGYEKTRLNTVEDWNERQNQAIAKIVQKLGTGKLNPKERSELKGEKQLYQALIINDTWDHAMAYNLQMKKGAMDIKKSQILAQLPKSKKHLGKLFFINDILNQELKEDQPNLGRYTSYKNLCKTVYKNNVDAYIKLAHDYFKDLNFYKQIGRYNKNWGKPEWIMGNEKIEQSKKIA